MFFSTSRASFKEATDSLNLRICWQAKDLRLRALVKLGLIAMQASQSAMHWR